MTLSDAPFESEYMREAISLARKSLPSPNPRVGAVLVKAGEIVGRGYHAKPGAPHAEVMAIASAGSEAAGSDLYVTLEPCVHVGRTGPCVKAIERAKIKRVFVGMADPDIRVNGEGIKYLRDKGIEVTTFVDEAHCRYLLKGYIIHRTKGRPLISLKSAITLDGYIATTNRDSKWISSSESRKVAHMLRADSDTILVGVDTVIHDNPMLTVRAVDGPSPLRIVLDSTLRIPNSSNLLRTASEIPVMLVYTNATSEKKERFANMPGVTLLECPSDNQGRVSLPYLTTELGDRGVLSLLVEGGANVISAFLETGLPDQLILFIAPKILGNGISFSTYPNAKSIRDGLQLTVQEITRIGDDIFYRATIKNRDRNRETL
jgi:diaminohydroxyphosphoribosylaminopyrimidine deaminase / 5-amino-6-(5-phosphoribosylamino)uracil reductase